jgi:hypothetical protein
VNPGSRKVAVRLKLLNQSFGVRFRLTHQLFVLSEFLNLKQLFKTLLPRSISFLLLLPEVVAILTELVNFERDGFHVNFVHPRLVLHKVKLWVFHLFGNRIKLWLAFLGYSQQLDELIVVKLAF